ncbi:DUF2637 domain-containing protein [Streptomyces sp. NPDC002917]|uniref:DUF2637 domain-containing protein n=1 Tax=Streptomyces sp. NPDC002917 TaxID=3364671 RepID=UPI00367E9BDB
MSKTELTLPPSGLAGQMTTRARWGTQVWLAVGAAVQTTSLTGVSFWPSSAGLHDLASAHRLQTQRASAWPAIVGSFIAVGEMLILRASLAHLVGSRAIVLTTAGSLGSIALNVTGVGVSEDPLDYATAAAPPVAALLAFGVLIRQVNKLLTSRQQALMAPPMPTSAPVTPSVEAPLPEPHGTIHAPVHERVVTPGPEPISGEAGEPLPQREQLNAIIQSLYGSLGQQRPGARHMRQALRNADLPHSGWTCREARKRVETAEPHLRHLQDAVAT